jgi:hypothetical protein
MYVSRSVRRVGHREELRIPQPLSVKLAAVVRT